MNMRRAGEIVLVLNVFFLMLTQTGCNTNAGLRSTASYNYLLLEFESNRSQVKAGEPVQVKFTITNTGKQSTVIESKDTPVMDIIVQVVGDGPLLIWSEQSPDQVSHRLEWQPGESKVIEWTWTPKQGDVYSGAFHDIFLGGLLHADPGISQSASVIVCASDVCR